MAEPKPVKLSANVTVKGDALLGKPKKETRHD